MAEVGHCFVSSWTVLYYKPRFFVLGCALHDLDSGGFGESCILRIGDLEEGVENECGLKTVRSDFVGEPTRCSNSHPLSHDVVS